MIKLTKKQIGEYQQRWRRIELFQSKEVRLIPMSLKFKQLCFLMNSFPFLVFDKSREKETKSIRRRWITLKKKLTNENQKKEQHPF